MNYERNKKPNLIHGDVGVSWKSEILGLGINDNQDTIVSVVLENLVDFDVVGMEFRSGMVPSHDLLPGVNLAI